MKIKKMNMKVVKYIALISLLLVIISPIFTPVKVTEQTNMMELQYGFPFPFVEQWSSLTKEDGNLPFTVLIASPGDNPTKILFDKFIASYFIVILTLTSLVAGVRFLDKKYVEKQSK